MAAEFAVVNGTTPTTTGTKSFEISGFGTPQAAIITLSAANSTNNPEDALGLSYGHTDGTTDSYSCIAVNDGSNPVETRRESTTGYLVKLEEGLGTDLILGGWDSWATNGITIDFTTVDTVAYNISITLIKGCTNVYVGSQVLTTTGVTDITGVGFKGNLLLTHGVSEYRTTSQIHAAIIIGAAHNNSSDVVTQGACSIYNRDGTPVKTTVITYNNRVHANLADGTPGGQHEAITFDASGFSIDSNSDDPNGDQMNYMVIDTGDTDGVSVDIVDSPTSTGTWDVTAPGFTPQWGMLIESTCSTINTANVANPASFGISMFDDTTQSSMGIHDNDGSSGANCQSLSSTSNTVMLQHYSSGHTQLMDGSFTSFDSSGYNFSFPTYINATARKFLSVTVSSGSSVAPLAVTHTNTINNA